MKQDPAEERMVVRPESIVHSARAALPRVGQAEEQIVEETAHPERRPFRAREGFPQMGVRRLERTLRPGVEVSSEHRRHTVVERGRQPPCLTCAERAREEPQAFEACAGIQVRAHDTQAPRRTPGIQPADPGGDRHPPLPFERELDRCECLERTRGQNGVAPIFGGIAGFDPFLIDGT